MNKRDIAVQEYARQLVQREVYYCVSELVSTLSELAQTCGSRDTVDWEDDIFPLLEGTNWQEAAENEIDDADIERLEQMVDNVGYWSDALSKIDCPEDEVFEEWLESKEDSKPVLDTIRDYIRQHLSDYEAFCQEFDVDLDDYRSEVYEHWIVSTWVASKLKDAGYVVGDLCGLTIWARECTGQAIYLDSFWEKLAEECYADELAAIKEDEA